jgi:cytochrome c553
MKIFFILILSTLIAQAEKVPDAVAITQKGTPAGATACAGCHGTRGEGNIAGGFPILAQLPSAYIQEQLNDFATGTRVNSVMGPIAKAMNKDEIVAVANYYGDATLPETKTKTKKSANITRGQILSSIGDQKMQIQACANCHGPAGTGQFMFIPMLAGQPAAYLKAQLLAWKNGDRKNSPNQMQPIAKNLDEKSIIALSEFFQTMHVGK